MKGVLQPKVLVGLVTWNQKADTLECLASLHKVRYDNFEVIVVDNGSTDATAEAIRAQYPQVHLVVNDQNLGPAGGINCELRYLGTSGAEYLFILGNDTVLDPDALAYLVEVARSDEKIGLVVPKVLCYDRPNVLWFAGPGHMNWRKGRLEGFVQNVPDDGSYDTDKDFEDFPGGFILVRREAAEKAGFMDPDYFIYFEDSDWNLRIKRMGWRFAFAPKAKVWHKPSSSLGKESPAFYYYRTRNRLLFMKKNARCSDWLIFLPYFFGEYFYYVLYRLAREGKWNQLAASGWGVLDFFRGRFGKWNRS